MNGVRVKRLLTLAVLVLALSTICSLMGCSGGSDSSVVQSTQYQQKVYIVGEIKDPMTSATGPIATVQGPAPAINQIFVNRVPYDGVSTDAPIFIAAESVKSISETMQKGLRETYNNLKPIIIIHGGEAEINSVLGMLGLEQDYKLPDGVDYIELFALDKEKGLSFRWAMLPQGVPGANGPTNALVADPLQQAGLLHDWLSQDGSRVTTGMMVAKHEATRALAVAANASTQDLESYVSGYNSTTILFERGNSYQLSYWIYSVHDFKDKADWFYVRQEGQLNPSYAYKPYDHKDWLGSGYHSERYYVGSYAMDNWFDISSSKDIQLFKSSPETTTNQKEVTSSMDWEFSGDLGFEGTSPTGKVGAKLNLKDSTKVTVQDCQVYNKSLDNNLNAANAKWLYQFAEATPHVYYSFVSFDQPAVLQRSLFKPTNNWLWRVSEDVRKSIKGRSFLSQIDIDSIESTAKDVAAYWLSSYKHNHDYFSRSVYVALKYPPVLMVDNDKLNLTKAGQSSAMAIAVGRDWKASSDQTWCRIEPASGTTDKKVNITVDENTTGASRVATITFKTNDGMGSATTEIFQSQY